MKKFILIALALAALSVFNTNCGRPIQITEQDKSQLDPNFAGYTGVLLILRNYDNKRGYNSIDKATLKAFKALYKGEFLMISVSALDQYPDLDKYRFYIRPGFTDYNKNTFTYYYMKDRKTNKDYTTKKYPGYNGLEKFPIAFEYLRTSK